MQDVTIKVGDEVTIKAQGITVTGTVLSADNWGGAKRNETEDNWYIELGDATGVRGGYSYWKQPFDGGYIVAVNGKEVPR